MLSKVAVDEWWTAAARTAGVADESESNTVRWGTDVNTLPVLDSVSIRAGGRDAARASQDSTQAQTVCDDSEKECLWRCDECGEGCAMRAPAEVVVSC